MAMSQTGAKYESYTSEECPCNGECEYCLEAAEIDAREGFPQYGHGIDTEDEDGAELSTDNGDLWADVDNDSFFGGAFAGVYDDNLYQDGDNLFEGGDGELGPKREFRGESPTIGAHAFWQQFDNSGNIRLRIEDVDGVELENVYLSFDN